MLHKLGVDIGGVIIAEIKAAGGLAHIDDDHLNVPPIKGAFEGLVWLEGIFGSRRFLISKAREEVEEPCRAWLKHQQFFETTRIPESHLHFCRERSGKRAICEKLGITHFIDDKLEVLSHLIGIVPNLYLFNPDESEMKPYSEHLPLVTIVPNWQSFIAFMETNP